MVVSRTPLSSTVSFSSFPNGVVPLPCLAGMVWCGMVHVYGGAPLSDMDVKKAK